MKPLSVLLLGLRKKKTGMPRTSPDSESGEANPLCWGPPGGLAAQISPGSTNWPPIVQSQHSFNMYKSRFQACSPHGLICLNEGQFWVSWAQLCPEIVLLCQSLFGNRTHTVIPTVAYSLLSTGCLEDKWGDHRGVHCKRQPLLRAG